MDASRTERHGAGGAADNTSGEALGFLADAAHGDRGDLSQVCRSGGRRGPSVLQVLLRSGLRPMPCGCLYHDAGVEHPAEIGDAEEQDQEHR